MKYDLDVQPSEPRRGRSLKRSRYADMPVNGSFFHEGHHLPENKSKRNSVYVALRRLNFGVLTRTTTEPKVDEDGDTVYDDKGNPVYVTGVRYWRTA